MYLSLSNFAEIVVFALNIVVKSVKMTTLYRDL